MKKTFFILFCAFGIALGASAQKTLNGITFPANIKKDTTQLLLNGAGIRKKVFFKLYVAGLYLQSKTQNPNDIINGDKEMLMRLTITSGMISSNNMSEAIEEGFKKSMNGNTAPLQSKIDMFINTFKKEEIKEGDVFEIWYVPNVGIQPYKTGKLQNPIP